MRRPYSEIAAMFGIDSVSNVVIDTLLTDSRSLTRPDSSLFFAIRTPGGNDGHRFIKNLYDKGVRYFVVNEIPEEMAECNDASFIITDDVIGALQKIATLPHKATPEPCKRDSDFCKNRPGHGNPEAGETAGSVETEVVGITGSRGKTTVKEWIFQLLEPLCEIARSPRSFNSRIGVPLSMWEIEDSTELALIEAGISRKGEMASLAECINPRTVIITNIGDAHSDGFPSLKEKAMEKALLASGLHTKKILYNLDSPFLKEAVEQYASRCELICWSTRDNSADIFIFPYSDKGKANKGFSYIYNGETHAVKAPIVHDYDLENAGAALAFLISEGLDATQIADRFACLKRIGTRLNVSEGINGCSVIHDSYTSDFSSLRPAIDFMMRRAMPHQTPTLILSDIRHETTGGNETYEAIARVVRESGIEKFIGVGKNLMDHAPLFGKDAKFFRNTEELLAQLTPGDFNSEIILVKGAPEFEFDRVAEMLEARKHETVLEVNLDAMVENYNYFRSLIPTGTGIVAMVKAFGYGAGSYEIAKTLQDCGAAYLAVAVLDEGIDLRRNGITMPIMVMNPKAVNYKAMFSNRLEPEIYSLDMLREVIKEAQRNGIENYPIHLKLDTGMHRTGLLTDELDEAATLIKGQSAVKLASMFSHLATADCLDMDKYTEAQLSRFRDMTERMMQNITYPVKRHVLNTAGIVRYPEHHYDMVRLGIGLYGANTLPLDIEKPLRPISTLRTVIISIREWEPDQAIGYGRKGILTRKSRIATIPIGYADGMNRRFGYGNIAVKVNGKDAPTVGTICMDACMIDVTGIDCEVGDSVEVFGPDAPVQRLADVLQTIPYEILTSVSPRVKRVYYRE